MMKRVGWLSVVALLVCAGCAKYEDGGAKAKSSANIEASWTLAKYFRNGADETAKVLITGLTETYQAGAYARVYVDRDGKNIMEAGTYALDDDKNIIIDGVSSLADFSDQNSTLSSSLYSVLKLTADELWYEYENGGSQHEFHFNKK